MRNSDDTHICSQSQEHQECKDHCMVGPLTVKLGLALNSPMLAAVPEPSFHIAARQSALATKPQYTVVSQSGYLDVDRRLSCHFPTLVSTLEHFPLAQLSVFTNLIGQYVWSFKTLLHFSCMHFTQHAMILQVNILFIVTWGETTCTSAKVCDLAYNQHVQET